MGMASSQARLLNLTSRMHQIEYKAAKIEAEKLQMANESRRAYLEYQNAMEQTKIQRQTLGKDASIEWKDLTFADLMYGTGEAPASTGATTFGAFFGGTEGTNSTSYMNNMIGMYSLQDGKMFVTSEMATAYDFAKDNGGRDAFARKMGATATITGTSGVSLNVDDIDYDQMMADLAREFAGKNSVIPDEKPTNTNEPVNEDDVDYTITRKGANNGNVITIPAGSTGQVLKVEDDIKGTKYYTISTTDEAVKITILDNGRLFINGNSAIITADNHQQDDIILNGVLNTINTGDEDDIVRVGMASDTYGFYDDPLTYANSINSGDGNDYVQNYGNNFVNAGNGNKDVLYDYLNHAVANGIEYTNSVDNGLNQLDWIMQGGYGDCQTLSLINSINNQGKFNDYFHIKAKSNGSWDVTFKKSDITVNVTPNMITSENATGDNDTTLIEAAFKKAIANDLIGIGEIGNSNNYHEIGKVILGNDKGYAIGMNKTIFDYLLQQYKYGGISNLVVGTSQDISKTAQTSALGIISQHAYSVKSFNENSITLVNPHDSKDSITLDWHDFYEYFKSILVIGDAADKVESKFNSSNIDVEQNLYFGDPNSTGGNYNYYCQIYDEIERVGGYTTVPPQMLHDRQYLANMLNSGFAFLKEYNSKTNEWEDTSIATNTKLQEVQDESGLRKAEAKYEADMRRIDYKDRKFDYDLAALDNERNAIKNEMETLKTVARDNVERTFKLFG